MADLTPDLAAVLVAACPRYAYHDQVAISCGVTWSWLRSQLVQGVTSGREPWRSFSSDYYAADSALGRRVHELLTTGSLELELEGIPLDAIPVDLAERIDSHWGPVLSQMIEKSKPKAPEPYEEPAGTGARVKVRLKGPDRKALAEWAAKRWPWTEHVASILPMLESKPVKRKAMVESLRHPTPEMQVVIDEAGLVAKEKVLDV